MERNWLIRTTQKQILGPVAKSKVLEFLEKGALGPNDEVASGNGYWFSLKEKDLVEKYLMGDVPQGYNPISESKSVISKRENPDRTSSLSAAPARLSEPVNLPQTSELEYPDITLINTKASLEEIKIPTSDDLEFPDISLISKAINNSPGIEINQPQSIGMKPVESVKQEASPTANDEPVVYPDNDDLAYPDLGAPPKIVEAPDLILTLDTPSAAATAALEKPVANLAKDDKKLLHERKVKASLKIVANSDVVKELPKEKVRSALPEHLKKRNDNYLMYILVIMVLIIISLFFYYYSAILNKPLPV